MKPLIDIELVKASADRDAGNVQRFLAEAMNVTVGLVQAGELEKARAHTLGVASLAADGFQTLKDASKKLQPFKALFGSWDPLKGWRDRARAFAKLWSYAPWEK